jgi:small subunit ribosomal protein S7
VIKEEIENETGTETTSMENQLALGQMENIAAGGQASDPVELTHKFGLPSLPIPSDANLKYRYDPVVTQVTNLLMKHGKKSVAQRVSSPDSMVL